MKTAEFVTLANLITAEDEDESGEELMPPPSDSEPMPIRSRRKKSNAMQIAHSLELGSGFSGSYEHSTSFGSWEEGGMGLSASPALGFI